MVMTTLDGPRGASLAVGRFQTDGSRPIEAQEGKRSRFYGSVLWIVKFWDFGVQTLRFGM